MRLWPAVALGVFAAQLFAQQPAEKPCTHPELRAELLRRTEVEQSARQAQVAWLQKNGFAGGVKVAELPPSQRAEIEAIAGEIKKADDDNRAWFKALVEKEGWPTISRVGRDGAEMAWLLAQHSDADRAFQRKCLDLMTAAPAGEVDPALLAYLTDRVLLAEGKKQLYGTQTMWDGEKRVPRPLEDETHVDERRKAAGLAPLADYLKGLNGGGGAQKP